MNKQVTNFVLSIVFCSAFFIAFCFFMYHMDNYESFLDAIYMLISLPAAVMSMMVFTTSLTNFYTDSAAKKISA